MNNSLIESALNLKSEIHKEELIQEYLRLKKLLSDNEELANKRLEIAKAYSNKEYERHKLLKNEYENIPLVKNFYTLKEEVYELFKEIIDILDI